jgi:hypothetical protein
MDGEGVQAIIEAGKESASIDSPKEIAGDGYKFLALETLEKKADGSIIRSYDLRPQPAKELRPEKLVIHTLTGLVDYVRENRDTVTLADCMLHVVNHKSVLLVTKPSGEFHQRTVHVEAAFEALIGTPAANFQFGQYCNPEDFNIALQALFAETPERKALLDVVGNIKTFTGGQVIDDGSAQQVEASAGVHFGEKTNVPNPVVLRPFRTFRDVAQPESKFIVRLKGKPQEMPQLALFEADGGGWKLQAISNIADFLHEQLAVEKKPADAAPGTEVKTLVSILA